MTQRFLNIVSLIVFLAIIYLLVKPSSLGPSLIKASTESFAALINYSVAG